MGFPLQFGDFQFHVDFLGLFLPLQKKTLQMVPNCSHEFLSFWDIGRSRNFGGGDLKLGCTAAERGLFNAVPSDWDLIFTGHSLGGALALLAATKVWRIRFGPGFSLDPHAPPKRSGRFDSFWRKAGVWIQIVYGGVVSHHHHHTPPNLFMVAKNFWEGNIFCGTFFGSLGAWGVPLRVYMWHGTLDSHDFWEHGSLLVPWCRRNEFMLGQHVLGA